MGRLIDKDNGTVQQNWTLAKSGVKVENLHSNLISYFNTLPTEYQQLLKITSGHEAGTKHADNSRHYRNRAVDVSWNQKLWDYVHQDPNRLRHKITLIDPNHGTAKHFHFSHGDGGENKADVWMDVYGKEAEDYLAKLDGKTPNSTSTTNTNTSVIPTTFDTSFIDKQIEANNAIRDEMMRKAELEEQQKKVLEAKQKAVAAKAAEQQQIASLVSGHELSNVQRKKKATVAEYALGGEFDGLENNLKFKLQNLNSVLASESNMYEQAIKNINPNKYTKIIEEIDRQNSSLQNQKNNFLWKSYTDGLASIKLDNSPKIYNDADNTASLSTLPKIDAPKTVEGIDVEKILAVIRKRESNNNYNAKASSSASGAYQFINKTWRDRAAKAGFGNKYATAKDAPKEVQDAVARHYVTEILNKSKGNLMAVPTVWYTGNFNGNMTAEQLAANKGLTSSKYNQNWLKSYNAMS